MFNPLVFGDPSTVGRNTTAAFLEDLKNWERSVNPANKFPAEQVVSFRQRAQRKEHPPKRDTKSGRSVIQGSKTKNLHGISRQMSVLAPKPLEAEGYRTLDAIEDVIDELDAEDDVLDPESGGVTGWVRGGVGSQPWKGDVEEDELEDEIGDDLSSESPSRKKRKLQERDSPSIPRSDSSESPIRSGNKRHPARRRLTEETSDSESSAQDRFSDQRTEDGEYLRDREATDESERSEKDEEKNSIDGRVSRTSSASISAKMSRVSITKGSRKPSKLRPMYLADEADDSGDGDEGNESGNYQESESQQLSLPSPDRTPLPIESPELVQAKPKRGRGRPRKYPIGYKPPKINRLDAYAQEDGTVVSPPKRKRGRPRKYPRSGEEPLKKPSKSAKTPQKIGQRPKKIVQRRLGPPISSHNAEDGSDSPSDGSSAEHGQFLGDDQLGMFTPPRQLSTSHSVYKSRTRSNRSAISPPSPKPSPKKKGSGRKTIEVQETQLSTDLNDDPTNPPPPIVRPSPSLGGESPRRKTSSRFEDNGLDVRQTLQAVEEPMWIEGAPVAPASEQESDSDPTRQERSKAVERLETFIREVHPMEPPPVDKQLSARSPGNVAASDRKSKATLPTKDLEESSSTSIKPGSDENADEVELMIPPKELTAQTGLRKVDPSLSVNTDFPDGKPHKKFSAPDSKSDRDLSHWFIAPVSLTPEESASLPLPDRNRWFVIRGQDARGFCVTTDPIVGRDSNRVLLTSKGERILIFGDPRLDKMRSLTYGMVEKFIDGFPSDWIEEIGKDLDDRYRSPMNLAETRELDGKEVEMFTPVHRPIGDSFESRTPGEAGSDGSNGEYLPVREGPSSAISMTRPAMLNPSGIPVTYARGPWSPQRSIPLSYLRPSPSPSVDFRSVMSTPSGSRYPPGTFGYFNPAGPVPRATLPFQQRQPSLSRLPRMSETGPQSTLAGSRAGREPTPREGAGPFRSSSLRPTFATPDPVPHFMAREQQRAKDAEIQDLRARGYVYAPGTVPYQPKPGLPRAPSATPTPRGTPVPLMGAVPVPHPHGQYAPGYHYPLIPAAFEPSMHPYQPHEVPSRRRRLADAIRMPRRQP